MKQLSSLIILLSIASTTFAKNNFSELKEKVKILKKESIIILGRIDELESDVKAFKKKYNHDYAIKYDYKDRNLTELDIRIIEATIKSDKLWNRFAELKIKEDRLFDHYLKGIKNPSLEVCKSLSELDQDTDGHTIRTRRCYFKGNKKKNNQPESAYFLIQLLYDHLDHIQFLDDILFKVINIKSKSSKKRSTDRVDKVLDLYLPEFNLNICMKLANIIESEIRKSKRRKDFSKSMVYKELNNKCIQIISKNLKDKAIKKKSNPLQCLEFADDLIRLSSTEEEDSGLNFGIPHSYFGHLYSSCKSLANHEVLAPFKNNNDCFSYLEKLHNKEMLDRFEEEELCNP